MNPYTEQITQTQHGYISSYVFSPNASWFLRPLGNHAILNLSPSWKDVASFPLAFLINGHWWVWSIFNVQSICCLTHREEMSRSIICTCTGKVVWHGNKNDRSGVRVRLSRRLLFDLDILVEWLEEKRHKAVCLYYLQLSNTMNHQT